MMINNIIRISCFIAALGFLSPAKAEVTDPCPNSIQALGNTPDDLSKVQADIDRFTLCVERAQLLKRLNTLALENQQDLEQAPLIDTGFNVPQIVIPDGPDDFNINPNIPEEDEVPPQWMILSIFGSGIDLSAKIINQDGYLAQIKKGDSLPDGSKIANISKTSVTLIEGDEKLILNWIDENR